MTAADIGKCMRRVCRAPSVMMGSRRSAAVPSGLACLAAMTLSVVVRAPGAAAVTALTDWNSGFMTFYGERQRMQNVSCCRELSRESAMRLAANYNLCFTMQQRPRTLCVIASRFFSIDLPSVLTRLALL